MLAPLALIALLIGGTQAALVVTDQEARQADQSPVVAAVETANTNNAFVE
jgi:hypothetical protein